MKKFTKVRRVHLNNITKAYNLKVKFNSYKDKSVTFDIVDTNGFSILDAPLIDTTYNYIYNSIIMPITKIFHSNNLRIDINIRELYKELIKAISLAELCNGDLTHDYDIHECQALVDFGHHKNK